MGNCEPRIAENSCLQTHFVRIFSMTTIRYTYIDYLRGFMFLLMAFDHTLHAYAQNWGRFWFIQDFERSSVWDAFYLFDQSIIMPMVFLLPD